MPGLSAPRMWGGGGGREDGGVGFRVSGRGGWSGKLTVFSLWKALKLNPKTLVARCTRRPPASDALDPVLHRFQRG